MAILLNEKCIKEYLESSIIFWRKRRDCSEDEQVKTIAACYVDAFQTVMVSMFDELLN